MIRWERPKKPQIRYDVEEFIVRRLRKSLFARWKRFSEKFITAKKMRRKILSKFICLYVRAWRDVTRYHLKVMTHIVSEWKQYEKSILIDPFRIWSNYISTKIKRRECQLRLVGVFSRSKTRKMMFNIFRCWRHEAIYGQTSAMYSRQELMQSLVEQKNQCKRIEIAMNDSIESVAEMNHAMEKNFKVISLLKNEITKKDLLLEDHMMSLHNAEQEII